MKHPRLNQLKELALAGDESAAADLFKEFPDAFIWNNNGTYWARVTAKAPNEFVKGERIAVSLNTRNLEEARRNRNKVFGEVVR
jgi:hypothetical protein